MAEVRISDQGRYLGIVARYNSLLAQQTKLQQEIASGKRFSNADEDPIAVSISQRLGTEEARLQQDIRNAGQVSGFVNATEGVLNSAVDYVMQAQQLAIRAEDPSVNPQDRQALSQQVDQILQNMIGLGARQFGGRTLLSGSISRSLPPPCGSTSCISATRLRRRRRRRGKRSSAA